ncbi:hypothetical protein M758_11G115500 [Ceratodon purpureus]|nr:hypothetical protein M758_11G115500 [Ceratodon purpureus]
MALVCPNPRDRLGPVTTLPGEATCVESGFRNTQGTVGELHMAGHLGNPCHSAGGRGDRDVAERTADRRGELIRPDLEFSVGSEWNTTTVDEPRSLAPAAPFSSWSNHTNSSSFPSSSAWWLVPPLGANSTTIPSDVAYSGMNSGFSSNSFAGALPRQLQAGGTSGLIFSGNQAVSCDGVQELHQNAPPALINPAPRKSWGKIQEAPHSQKLHQHESLPHGSYMGYGAHTAREMVKDQFNAGMDEDSVSAWLDGMITDMMEAMPGVPVEHLFTNLSEVLAPCNLQLEKVIESRFQSLFGPGCQTQKHLPPPGGPRGKRARDKGDNTEGLTDWGNLMPLQNESRPYQNTPARTEFGFPRTQRRALDNLQLSLEPADERNLRHLHATQQTAHHQHYLQPQQPRQEPKPSGFPHSFTLPSAAAQYPPSNTRSFRDQPREPESKATNVATDEEGLQLMALLLQCAEEVSAENYDEANSILPQLSELATPYGTSVQRVVAYFSEGMASRLMTSCLGLCSPLPENQRLVINDQSFMPAMQVFNELSPFVKFSHFTANQAISEAFEGMNTVHIIDLDIMQGLQWPGLFHILASRPGGPPHVHITGLGTSMEALQATGKQMIEFAGTLGIPFEFTAVADKIGNVDSSALNVEFPDALAIHWMQHSLYDVTGSVPATLSLIQKLNPKVVTVVEQNLPHGGTFLSRFVEALHYYSALFDSLGASYPADSPERHMVEQQLLSCEIKNILAVGGGGNRSADEQVKVGHWREEFSKAGFKPISLGGKAAHQAALLLGLYPCEGYTLQEHAGTLNLGWKDLSLFTASAWSCCQ